MCVMLANVFAEGRMESLHSVVRRLTSVTQPTAHLRCPAFFEQRLPNQLHLNLRAAAPSAVLPYLFRALLRGPTPRPCG